MPPKKKQTARMKLATKGGKPRPKRVVEDLPPEVLTEIFKYVHVSSMVVVEDTPERMASPGSIYRDPQKRPQAYAGHCSVPIPGPDVIETAVVAFSFPLHTISSVCRLWRDIAHNLPEYSSHLLIFIDENFTPLSEVQKQIEQSGNVPLDVFVANRELEVDDEDEDDSQQAAEKSRVGAVMKLLAPLIPRCRCLVFDVKHSSSLPYISQDFRGHAPHLRVLKLQCMIDDGSSRLPHAPELPAEEKFTCPLLNTIALDGSTFMDACNVPSWTNQLKSLVIDTLSISNFTAPGADENEDSYDDDDQLFDVYTLADNLSDIGFIRNLIFNNINTTWRTGDREEGCYEIKLNNFTVIGTQDIEFMQEFQLITFGSTLCYHHLADTPLTRESIPLVHHLRLQRTPSMQNPDFNWAIARFFGNRLDLIDCEDLSDELLLSIGSCCEPLRRLYIEHCPNITIEGLKGMITERNSLVKDEESDEDEENDDDSDGESILEWDDDDDELIETGYTGYERPPRGFPFLPIHRLVVVGHPEKLTKQNRQWFKDHVKSFHWE